jgi:hypothetical protein
MADRSSGNKGHQEAGTLPNSQDLAAAMADLGENSDADQPGLFFDPLDSLAQKADKANAARKGAGRPPGSANRRNSDLFDLAMARGYKHPFIRLMEIVSADPNSMLGSTPKQKATALTLQIRAAEALLPYDMAKKPQQIEVKGTKLHVFVAGKLSDLKAGGGAGFSLTGDSEQDQGVSVVEVEPVGREPVVRTDNSQQDQEHKPSEPAD